MISKELLSKVLKNTKYLTNEDIIIRVGDILDCTFSTNLHYFTDVNQRYINIYELAHKCKEWAYCKKYALTPMNDFGFNNNDVANFKIYWTTCYINLQLSGAHLHSEIADTEPEAIFKACEWILANDRNI